MQRIKKYLIVCLALACLALAGCAAESSQTSNFASTDNTTTVTDTGNDSASENAGSDSTPDSTGSDSRTPVEPITDGGDFQGK